MRDPLTSLALLCGLLAPLALNAPLAVAADTTAANARVIVKFKADAATVRKQALAARAQDAEAMQGERASALGGRTGMALASGRGIAERMQVVTATGLSSEQLAARLAKDAEVEYAVPDQRRRAFVAPNDPLYSLGPPLGSNTGGPAVGQWYLRGNDSVIKSAINVEDAWAVTGGSSSVVVAVLDTGLRFDHADLQAGNVLPGYDFVSDVFTANEGGGRDADASDPGDFVTANLVGSNDCTAADVGNSSWHGTETLGLIGASTANGIGMAGIGRGNVRVMPIRVLGRCGGFDSDIIAGMRWAAGLAISGVPSNSTPARVLNLSLGGSGACSAAYQNAISEILAAGTVIVASAGNSAGHPVSTPANCTGVIGVAGLRHVGTKVGFSDIGPEITLSAPGGNCINITSGSPCLYPILSLSNSGTQGPVSNAAGGSTYTDSYKATIGTSFSAPLVAGTAALMLSANAALTPADVKRLLQSSARAFPTTGGDNGDGTVVTTCNAPVAGVDQLQCYCTTTTCGAGMLDAGGAVRAALAAVGTARITQSPLPAFAGQTITLSSTASQAGTGRSFSAYQWSLDAAGGIARFTSATNAATATLTTSGAGSFTARLTLTTSSGAQVSTTTTIAVTTDPTPPPVATIRVSPTAPLAGTPVQLDGSSSTASSGRSVASYRWAVSQGSTVAQISAGANAAVATLATLASGAVTVTLTVTDSTGVATTTTSSFVVGLPIPVPRIQVMTGTPVAGNVITLDGSTSSVGTGRALRSFQWTLSSGGAVAALLGSGNSSTASLLPSSVGVLTATLTITDDLGTSATSTQTLNVSPNVASPPTASISIAPATPVAGATIQLGGGGSSAGSGRAISQYRWALLEGSSIAAFSGAVDGSTAALTTRTNGLVIVALTVTDNLGAAASSTSTFVVGTAPPVARIVPGASSVTVGASVTFDGSTSSAGAGRTLGSYQWSISSGGNIATLTGPTNASSATVATSGTGTVAVTLTTTNDAGLVSSATQNIDVGAAPAAPQPSSGGGAMGGGWLLLLAAAVLAAGRGAARG